MSREPVISERPPSLPSATPKVKVPCGTLFMVFSTNPKCEEVELHLGKGGSCPKHFLEVIQGLLTIMRRQLTPIPRKMILKQLRGIKCPFSNDFSPSCSEAIRIMLAKEWGIEEGEESTTPA